MNDTARGKRHQYLLFELTQKCQNDCVFCYNVWKEDETYPKEELGTEDAITLVEKVIEESGCRYMGLTGGEPLLRKDIFEIARRVAAKGVTPIIISNGALLTKDNVEKLVKSGVTDFEVSVHSHEARIHDKLVGRRGSFDEAIEAIVNIKSLGANASTVYVATRENIRSFREFVELNALLKVSWILFNRVACGGTCLADWASLAPSPSQLRKALDEGAPVAEKYKIGLGMGVQIQPCLLDLSKYPNVRTGFCPLNNIQGGRTYFAVDPAGNLRMCNRSKVILGNLLDESFDEVAERAEAQEICRAIPEFCCDCDLARVCAGGCKADALSYHGTLDRPDPYLEMWKGAVKRRVGEVRKA